MSILFRSALACAASLAAGAAMAQSAPAAASAELQKQAYNFVQTYGAQTVRLGKIARWADPVCVKVTGLDAAKTGVIQSRVEEVAKAVGLRVQPAGCAQNIEIVFDGHPQILIDKIAETQEVLLGYNHRNDKSLRTVSRPIQAWYVTASVGGGGPNAGALFAQGEHGETGGIPMQVRQKVIDDPLYWSPTGCGDNHFNSCLKSAFVNVMVMVDTSKIGTAGVGVISDYVTMLALSQPRALERCNVMPSIANLFADSCQGRAAPDGLTPADAAYLTALYATDPEADGPVEQIDMATRMTKILGPASVAAR
jgi:hypothetical protein